MNKKLLILFDIPLFALNYIFLVLAGKILNPLAFGELNGLLATASILFIFGSSLEMIEAGTKTASFKYKRLIIYTFYTLMFSMLFTFLPNFGTELAVVLFCIALFHPTISVLRGQFIKTDNYFKYYMSIYSEAIPKIIIPSIALLLAYQEIDIFLYSLASAYVLSFLVSVFLREKSLIDNVGMTLFDKKRFSVIFNQLILFVLLGFDILIVQSFYTEISGYVSLAVRISQVPFLLLLTAFQFELKSTERYLKYNKKTFLYLLVTLLTFFCVHIVFFLLGSSLIEIFFSKEYLQVLNYISHFLFVNFFLCLTYLLSLKSANHGSYVLSILLTFFMVANFLVLRFLFKDFVEFMNFHKMSSFCFFILAIVLYTVCTRRSSYE